MLKAGAAVVEINPSLPCFLAGMGSDRPVAHKIHDPICARAVVVEDEHQGRFALCVIDTLGINTVDRAEVQQLVAAKLAWPAAQIQIAGTHTHNGPPVLRFYRSSKTREGYDGAASIEYWRKAIPRIAEALVQAASNLRPAEMALGCGSVSLNINRWHARGEERIFIPYARKTRGDSSHDLPANLRGDPETVVLHFRDKRSHQTIATWLHWTAHPICVCLQASQLSADYPYFAGRVLEKELGGVFLFSNGAIGDMHPKDFDTGFSRAEALGTALAEDALRALHGREFSAQARVGLLEERLELPRVDSLKGSVSSCIAAGCIGEFAFSTWPGEPWVEVGLRLKAQSPFKHTVMIGCANDYQGYFALRETMQGHSYDTPHTQPGTFTFEIVDEMVERSAKLLQKLKAQ